MLPVCVDAFHAFDTIASTHQTNDYDYLTKRSELYDVLCTKYTAQLVDEIGEEMDSTNVAKRVRVEEDHVVEYNQRLRNELQLDSNYKKYVHMLRGESANDRARAEFVGDFKRHCKQFLDEFKDIPTIVISSTLPCETHMFMHEFYAHVTNGKLLPMHHPNLHHSAVEGTPSANVYFVHGETFRVRTRLFNAERVFVDVEATEDTDVAKLVHCAVNGHRVFCVDYPIVIEAPKIPEGRCVLFVYDCKKDEDLYAINSCMYADIGSRMNPRRRFFDTAHWGCGYMNSEGKETNALIEKVKNSENPSFLQFDVLQLIPRLNVNRSEEGKRIQCEQNARAVEERRNNLHGTPFFTRGGIETNPETGTKYILKYFNYDHLYPSFVYHMVCGWDANKQPVGYEDLWEIFFDMTLPEARTIWKQKVKHHIFSRQGIQLFPKVEKVEKEQQSESV